MEGLTPFTSGALISSWFYVPAVCEIFTMEFPEHTVVVTGGGSGIGKRMAERFASKDASVAIADIQNAATVAEGLDAEAMGMETDVTDEESVSEFTDAVLNRFGTIDVLINNAAMYEPLLEGRDRSFDEIPVEEWRSVLDVNVTGVFICCKQMVPHMAEQGSGSVINIASAVMYNGVTGYPHYVTSKGAIPPLTRAIANEVGEDGVRVNAVAPGLVTSEASQQLGEEYLDTIADYQVLPRNGTPDDVIDTIEFLASDQSSFITASTLHPDGGISYR